MKDNYSQRLLDVIEYSREEAARLQNSYVGPEHLLLGIIRDGEGLAVEILKDFHVNLSEVKKRIEREIKNTMDAGVSVREVAITKLAERVLRMSMLEARSLKSEETDTEHLLLALLKEEVNVATRILMEQG
ncbi:MAG: Clp protease N-terminal domain-containing protein, partial [Parabacteroides sp.]